MIKRSNYNAFKAIMRKEIWRFTRLWVETVLPPVITMALYFTIFGQLIGPRIGAIEGFSFMQFIAPGLIMMAVVSNAYMNVTTSFYMSKFARSIEEILVSPVPLYLVLLGYVLSGALRGIIIGACVAVVALLFTNIHMHHIIITIITGFMAACLFATAGFINGLVAQSWDDISIIPTFIITPLTYFGGVFYSIDMLPNFWKHASYANPILYIVNVFRYGILGVSDIPITPSLTIIFIFTAGLFLIAHTLLKKGIGIKS